METSAEKIRLTEYSHGAGCGCKISPAVLTDILKSNGESYTDPRLLIGNDTRDDAAVYDLDGDNVVISTTDFFMPIVDDPFQFGGIASVNAMSDIYAMGGTPIMAIAVLGWPVNDIPAEVANKVIEGARSACKQAGIALAGGHSIDAPEPIFGLAVTGKGKKANIKANANATEGCELYLTKPLGIGILTTAKKKGLLKEEDLTTAIDLMLQLNDVGIALSLLESVKAMTDVTGFGLLGHLVEMCEGSGLSAEIEHAKVPRLDCLPAYMDQKTFPGGTTRNFDSYGHKVSALTDEQKALLCDPQTSGGLLVAVEPEGKDEFLDALSNAGLHPAPFGRITAKGEHTIIVK